MKKRPASAGDALAGNDLAKFEVYVVPLDVGQSDSGVYVGVGARKVVDVVGVGFDDADVELIHVNLVPT